MLTFLDLTEETADVKVITEKNEKQRKEKGNKDGDM